jgi:hypothetical protein
MLHSLHHPNRLALVDMNLSWNGTRHAEPCLVDRFTVYSLNF